MPVRDIHEDYAKEIRDLLVASEIRARIEHADEPLGGRVRRAKTEKVPYILVVGDDDVASRTVGVNARSSESPERGVPLQDFISRLQAEIESHGLPEGR